MRARSLRGFPRPRPPPWSWPGPAELDGNVGRKVGCRRACMACSKPDASLIKVGSLNAVPTKETPTGNRS